MLSLLRKSAGQVEFRAPDTAFEAREHLWEILEARNIPAATAMAALAPAVGLVHAVESETNSALEARWRLEP